jgi:hemolysin activation/secretion protein
MFQPVPIVSGVVLMVGVSPAAASLPSVSVNPVDAVGRSPLEFSADLTAQGANPVEDRFLQDGPAPSPPEILEEPAILSPELEDFSEEEVEIEIEEPSPLLPDESQPPAPDLSFPIQTIEVIGSTVFEREDLLPILQPLENREVTLSELQDAADAITQLYLDNGYLTSRAVLVDQEIGDGVVQIQVIEGRLADIQISGLQRLNDHYVRDRIQLGAGVPLRAQDLEEQLRLLRIDPLLDSVEASLRPSGLVGQSILVVRVTEANPWFGSFNVDNYSPPGVGSERMNLTLGYRNLTGLGDTFSTTYRRTTTGGAEIFDIGYRVPLNPMDGTLELRAVLDRNSITARDFVTLEISGESELYELSFRQPLRRRTDEEFALSLGLSHKTGQTFLFDLPTAFGIGPDEEGRSRVTALRFGQDYVRRDTSGAWAARSLFSFGLDLFDATINDAPVPDGRFFSWLFQGQRVQRLGKDHLLIALVDLQLTPDSLLPSEQFVIGGGQFVRGYRQNARSGDNGIRFMLEDRITLVRNEAAAPVFQLAPFFDIGAVWNHPDNPNTLPDQTLLASLGLGALWEPLPGFNLRLDYAFPLVDLADRGRNAQDAAFYFSVGYQF